ncbi:hypothetical protein U1Q18_047493 [Sarracenia purpurea var. burkii]
MNETIYSYHRSVLHLDGGLRRRVDDYETEVSLTGYSVRSEIEFKCARKDERLRSSLIENESTVKISSVTGCVAALLVPVPGQWGHRRLARRADVTNTHTSSRFN